MGMLDRDLGDKNWAKEAARATKAGRRVFVARFDWGQLQAPKEQVVDKWSIAIEQIEEEGWALADWAVMETRGRPAAFAVFRRT